MEAVYTYTRAQAISDGLQFNTDSLSDGLSREAGIKYPVYITEDVKKIVEESLKYGCNDLEGVLWDIFTMFRVSARKAIESSLKFGVIIFWKGKQKTFTFYSEIGPMDFDDPEPAITIMTEFDL